MKIISYRIIEAANTVNLTKKVNDSFAEGYQPLGSVKLVISHDGVYHYIQTLVRYLPE